MHIQMFVQMCMPASGSLRLMSGVFLYYSTPFIFRQGLLLNPEITVLASLGS